MSQSQKPPAQKNNFKVELDGTTMPGFALVSNADKRREEIDYQEGNDQTTTTMPGEEKHTNLVIGRGVTQDNQALVDWWEECTNKKAEEAKKNLATISVDQEGNQLRRYEYEGAIPVNFETADFDTRSNSEVAIEKMTIKFDDMTLKSP